MDGNPEDAGVNGGSVGNLDVAADKLYALPPGEFVAARTAMERAARAAGRRDLAAAIRGLAKPGAAAALTNRLARAHPDEVSALLELGDELRAATAAREGARLRELSVRRNKQVAELLTLARRLASDEGTKVTEDTARGVEESLRSAVADPAAGELLAAGRLTDVLEPTGFAGLFATDPEDSPPAPPGGDADAGSPGPARPGGARPGGARAGGARAGGAVPGPKPEPEPTSGAKPDARAAAAARRLEEAARKLDAAREDAEAAAAELDDARALLEARAAELAELDARVERARAELEAAEAGRRRAAGNERRAQAQLATAERSARAATRRLGDATAAHERAAADVGG